VLASRGELPLILQRPVRGPSGQAIVALLTPAGALFDGDLVDLEVECEPGTDVTLTTAAASKLNRCEIGEISFRLHVRVAADATFRYVPHELIPFAGTRYRQRIEVEAASGASVVVLEVIAPGTTNAPFAYEALGFSTSIYRSGALKIRERFALTPRSARQFGEWTHYGSLLAIAAPLSGSAERDSRVQLGESSLLDAAGVTVKALGRSSQTVRAALLSRLPAANWLQPLLPP
jgi:urease accessory protein